MAKVLTPNKDYDGISAGVTFVKGVGECADPYLLGWFKSKGYTVEGESEKDDNAGKGEGSEFDNMTVDELKAYAEANGINIGNSSSQKGILKKILEAKAE
jgi:hypothetical protein